MSTNCWPCWNKPDLILILIWLLLTFTKDVLFQKFWAALVLQLGLYKLSYRRDSARRRSLRRSRSLKVTDFGVNRKPFTLHDFILWTRLFAMSAEVHTKINNKQYRKVKQSATSRAAQTYYTNILSRTVCQLSHNICQIIAFDTGCLSLTH